jgi:hypothetical protein
LINLKLQVWYKKIKRGCHMLTEEKLNGIGARLEHLPGKSLGKVVQQVDVSISSARTATKLLKLFSYKVT